MTKSRDPEKTRQDILAAAFEEIHRFGFQSASLDNILRKASVTKGAMYHHFPNKNALGIAVIKEVVAPVVRDNWLTPLKNTDDPIGVLIATINRFGAMDIDETVELGCPLNNLAQEMSPLDEVFRIALGALFTDWQDTINHAIIRGQQAGNVRVDIDATSASYFIVASLEGSISLIKTWRSKQAMEHCGKAIITYLQSLLPDANRHDQ